MASFGARECVSRYRRKSCARVKTSCPMLKARIPHAVTSLRPNTCVPAMSADRACCQNASCSHQTQATIATSPIGTQCALRVLISRSSQTEGEFPVLEEDDAQAGAAVEKHRASRAGADFAGKPHCICPCRPHPGNKRETTQAGMGVKMAKGCCHKTCSCHQCRLKFHFVT
ncbi:uncharacterized protein LOC144158313 isoform X2 [Haemaphysalis longicornis]